MEDRTLTKMTLPELVARHAAQDTSRVFLQEATTSRSWTYASVHQEALRWGGAYERAGVKAGDTVLTMLSTKVEFFHSWIGLSWLHAMDVPVNTEYKGDMLRHVATNSQARLAMVEEAFLPQLLDILGDAPNIEQIVVLGNVPPASRATYPGVTFLGLDEFLSAGTPLVDPVPPQLHDLVSVLYTSGTTGPSKGVLQSWNQLRRNAYYAFNFDEVRSDDAFYFASPIYHQAGRLFIYMMAMRGGRFVFKEKFSVNEFWSDLRSNNATLTVLIGAMGAFVNGQPPTASDADNPLRIVQILPVLPDVDGFKKRFNTKVCTGFGMTEVSIVFREFDVTNDNAASCGRPVPGCEVRIVDEFDYEVPVGVTGELVVRCDEPWGHNQGYLGNPEATARAMRNQWIHTGDGFKRDEDGRYYFVDRLKDAIRRRGENISSTEVEAIVRTHPSILDVAAIAAPSEHSEDEVKICVLLEPGATLTPEQLIEYLIPVMPRFMIPRYIEFVSDLPRTANSRVKKAELRKDALNDRTWDREAAGIPLPR